jgi:hypothetical protein
MNAVFVTEEQICPTKSEFHSFGDVVYCVFAFKAAETYSIWGLHHVVFFVLLLTGCCRSSLQAEILYEAQDFECHPAVEAVQDQNWPDLFHAGLWPWSHGYKD